MGHFLARVNKHVERPLLCVAKMYANAFSPCSFSLPMDTFQVSPRKIQNCVTVPREMLRMLIKLEMRQTLVCALWLKRDLHSEGNGVCLQNGEHGTIL